MVCLVQQLTLAVGFNPFSVAVGDFNGDTILDLAVANTLSNNVSILLGNWYRLVWYSN